MNAPEIIREWIDKAEEDAAVAEREGRVRKQPAPGAVCYHAQQCTLEHFAALIDREGLVSLSRYATRFRYPGEAANLSDAKQALLLMRRYRAILRGMLGIK
jgi:hypothetical protein